MSISYEDIMTALKSFMFEMLASSKASSALLASQYDDLKSLLTSLCTQLSEIKAENTLLRNEINTLKAKVSSLESSRSTVHSQTVVGKYCRKLLNVIDFATIVLPMMFRNLPPRIFHNALFRTGSL